MTFALFRSLAFLIFSTAHGKLKRENFPMAIQPAEKTRNHEIVIFRLFLLSKTEFTVITNETSCVYLRRMIFFLQLVAVLKRSKKKKNEGVRREKNLNLEVMI